MWRAELVYSFSSGIFMCPCAMMLGLPPCCSRAFSCLWRWCPAHQTIRDIPSLSMKFGSAPER